MAATSALPAVAAQSPTSSKSRLLAVSIVAAIATAVFVSSLQHDVGFWDIGEMQTIPYILGIGHPTGYPTFILTGWLFSHLFAFGPVYWRINAMCALAYAGATAILCDFVWQETRRASVAIGISLAYAFSSLTWEHATHADAFALSVLSVALAFRFTQAWVSTGRSRYALSAAFILGLGLGVHLTIVWTIPGIVVYGSARTVRHGLRFATACGGSLVAGALVYIYLPVASAANFAARKDPLLALGVPPGRQFWDYAHPSTWSNFFWLVSGGQVDTTSHVLAMLRVQTYSLAAIASALRLLSDGFPFWLAALALLGAVVALRGRDRLRGVGLLLAAVGPVPFLISFTPETEPGRYWLVPCWILAALAGIGAGRVIDLIEASKPATWTTALAFASLLLVEQFHGAARYASGRYHPGLDYISATTRMIADGSIVVAPWVLATPLGYAAYVERSFGKRILDVGTPDGEARYLARWLKVRRAYVVDYAAPRLRGIAATYVGRAGLSAQPESDAKVWELTLSPDRSQSGSNSI